MRRLRARTGINFTVHMLRHSCAPELVRGGVPIEVVRRLLTHRSSATTSQIYVHLRAGDVRHSLADISKAHRLLGYEPTHTASKGLSEAMEWYLRHLNGER